MDESDRFLEVKTMADCAADSEMVTLVGPPELESLVEQTQCLGDAEQSSSVLKKDAIPTYSSVLKGDGFMDAMVKDLNSTTIQPEMTMGLTENMSATFLASGNPCLDFFFHVVPDTPAEELKRRLELSWEHNPLVTLKLICNLRGVRGTGKTDKESYYSAALWLHEHHPKTFASNVEVFANFGYYKDLLEVLYRLLEGADVRKVAKSVLKSKRKKKFSQAKSKRSIKPKYVSKQALKYAQQQKMELKKKKLSVPRGKRIEAEMERVMKLKAAARICRKENILVKAKRAVDKYKQDAEFRYLHDQVSDLFANHLKSDLQLLNSNKANKISLAAKWCPSIDSSYDKSLLLCESIARKCFLKSDPEYQNLTDAHYAYRVRDRLRKEILVPLRKALELPELYMSGNRWSELPYNRVASVAMKNYKAHFVKHDKERFEEYLGNVASGKAKIASGALLPHEIIASLSDEDGEQVAELQWRSMVDELLKLGSMKNCISVCDVSGSMNGTPMDVCIALGILLSEISEEPWKGKVITFSMNPQLQKVEGDTLLEKTKFIGSMDWGMNTDFQKVFDIILQVACENKLPKEAMIKRIFVFSDMEFDNARSQQCGSSWETESNTWDTDYEVIKEKFKRSGYENAVPEIVFWNLRNSRATPVPATEQGVALMSGFSKNLFKLFLKSGGVLNPEDAMLDAISGEEYRKLKVLD